MFGKCSIGIWALAEGGDGVPRERLARRSRRGHTHAGLACESPAAFGTAHSSYGLPAVIILGGLSDWADGLLARRYGRTRLGRDFDTTADLAFLTAAAVAARSAGRIPPVGYSGPGRHAKSLGTALSLAAVFGRARRPAVRARPWGAALRTGGLALCTTGATRVGDGADNSGQRRPSTLHRSSPVARVKLMAAIPVVAGRQGSVPGCRAFRDP